jgi:hypothetical protein
MFHKLAPVGELPQLADFVAEVGDCDHEVIASICWNGSRSTASWRTAAPTWLILLAPIGYAGHASTSGGGLAINFARRRKFWAMAASVNSN